MGLSRSLSGGSRRGPFRRYRNAVVMLGRMIALHHRMTQNAADMMDLIQETLNQADEAHSRRVHGGHDDVRHHHVRGLSLAESSRPRAHDHARLDEAELPGPGIRHSVNSEDLADPPPLVDAQSLQLHMDHQRNAAVNPKSLSYGVVTGGDQRGYRSTPEELHGAHPCRSAEHQEDQCSQLHHGQVWDRSVQNEAEAMPCYVLREDGLPGASSTSSTSHSSASSSISLRGPILIS